MNSVELVLLVLKQFLFCFQKMESSSSSFSFKSQQINNTWFIVLCTQTVQLQHEILPHFIPLTVQIEHGPITLWSILISMKSHSQEAHEKPQIQIFTVTRCAKNLCFLKSIYAWNLTDCVSIGFRKFPKTCWQSGFLLKLKLNA